MILKGSAPCWRGGAGEGKAERSAQQGLSGVLLAPASSRCRARPRRAGPTQPGEVSAVAGIKPPRQLPLLRTCPGPAGCGPGGVGRTGAADGSWRWRVAPRAGAVGCWRGRGSDPQTLPPALLPLRWRRGPAEPGPAPGRAGAGASLAVFPPSPRLPSYS